MVRALQRPQENASTPAPDTELAQRLAGLEQRVEELELAVGQIILRNGQPEQRSPDSEWNASELMQRVTVLESLVQHSIRR